MSNKQKPRPTKDARLAFRLPKDKAKQMRRLAGRRGLSRLIEDLVDRFLTGRSAA